MPLPLASAMPWLAGALGSLFTSVVGFFAHYMTRKAALVPAALVSITALTGVFFAALQGSLAGLSMAVPPEVSAGVTMIMPSNLVPCATIVLTARTLHWAYSWNIRVLQYTLFS